MATTTTPDVQSQHPAPSLSAAPLNDWLRPAAVLGALALLLAAFHGVRQEIKDVRQEIQGVRQEIRATEATLRSDFKADLQAVESRLRADNRALEEKLDRVLESLLTP